MLISQNGDINSRRISINYSSNIAVIGLTPVNEDMLNPIPWRGSESSYLTSSVLEFDDALQTTAKAHGVHYINVMDSFVNLNLKYIFPDGLHPNDEGHQVQSEKILEYLRNIKAL